MYRVTLMVAAVALLAISVPVHASKMDDRIDHGPGQAVVAVSSIDQRH
jgi:hypothetical protein